MRWGGGAEGAASDYSVATCRALCVLQQSAACNTARCMQGSSCGESARSGRSQCCCAAPLSCVAVRHRSLVGLRGHTRMLCCRVLYYVAPCCTVLRHVATCCTMLHHGVLRRSYRLCLLLLRPLMSLAIPRRPSAQRAGPSHPPCAAGAAEARAAVKSSACAAVALSAPTGLDGAQAVQVAPTGP